MYMPRKLSVNASSIKEKKSIEELLKKQGIISYQISKWDGIFRFSILVNKEDTRKLENELQKLGFGKSFQKGIIVQDIVCSYPPLKRKQVFATISDSEIKEDIIENTTPTWIYMGFVILAALVIGMGMLSNNMIVVIGGMLIAPVLYPIIGNSYYFLSANPKEVINHMKTTSISFLIPLLIGAILGLVSHPLVVNEIILGRSILTVYDLGVAAFAGAAGTLSLVTRKLSGFSGVTIAVAVLPPIVVSGIGIGMLNLPIFLGALIVTLMNIVIIQISSLTLLKVVGYPSK